MKIIRMWTEEEERQLENLYKTKTANEVAAILKRTWHSVTKKIYRLNLKLEEEERQRRFFLAGKIAAERINGGGGENNPNWKGGISSNHYHYKLIQMQRYPEKIKARKKLQRAVKSGKFLRMPCEVCGDTSSQAHHVDYNKPLDVKWLCRDHHREIHQITPCPPI